MAENDDNPEIYFKDVQDWLEITGILRPSEAWKKDDGSFRMCV
jgi:hypothetical protein